MRKIFDGQGKYSGSGTYSLSVTIGPDCEIVLGRGVFKGEDLYIRGYLRQLPGELWHGSRDYIVEIAPRSFAADVYYHLQNWKGI